MIAIDGNAFGLSEKSCDTVNSILKKYPCVEKAIVYGSRAKGNYKPYSDIDIALITSEDFSTATLSKIMTDFEESDLPYFVDVCDKKTLSSAELVSHIDRVGKVLYIKDE